MLKMLTQYPDASSLNIKHEVLLKVLVLMMLSHTRAARICVERCDLTSSGYRWCRTLLETYKERKMLIKTLLCTQCLF